MTPAPHQTAACKETGRVAPVIDQNRCEAKGDCVRVCPYNVFQIRELTAAERSALSWTRRIKTWAHGNRQAFATMPDACHACGLCVTACPERAISLAPVKKSPGDARSALTEGDHARVDR
jgi:4Fe-4S ferredoxin